MHTVLQYLMLLFTGALLHAQNTVEVTNTPYNSPEEAVCSIQLSQKMTPILPIWNFAKKGT